jgi:hypothetical protein
VLCGGSLIRASVVLLAGKHARKLCTCSAALSFGSSASRWPGGLACPPGAWTPAALCGACLQSRRSCSPPALPHQQAQLSLTPACLPARLPIMVSLSAGHCVADFGDMLGDVKLGLTNLNDTKAPTRKVKVSVFVLPALAAAWHGLLPLGAWRQVRSAGLGACRATGVSDKGRQSLAEHPLPYSISATRPYPTPATPPVPWTFRRSTSCTPSITTRAQSLMPPPPLTMTWRCSYWTARFAMCRFRSWPPRDTCR